jgi:type IV pilus assembly protein PilV
MKSPTAKSQQGVMLLEALIGILIFSLGILAMLGMQAVGMRATIDAKYRSEASFLANEIVGIMWGDAANLTNYATANCSSVPRCDAWMDRVQAVLPNATGGNAPTITVAGRQVTVAVMWQRPGESTASNHTVIAQIYRATD